MKARHGLECEDKQKPSNHGKDIADGDGQALKGMVKRSYNDDYGPGTPNLVLHLAAKYPRPKVERKTRYYGMKGLYSVTHYIYMFIAEDGIDEKVVDVAAGYSGSSKDHFYWSKGASKEASSLHRRERACGCPPCFMMMPEKCQMLPGSGLEAGIIPPGSSVRLESANLPAESRHTRNARNPLPEYCMGLKVGSNVVVRIAEEEREMNPDEEYFVAKIEERAKKIDKDEIYSAVEFKKGDWIVKIRWYIFCPSMTNRRGDRFYKKGDLQWIGCASIVRSVKSKDVIMRWSGQHYQLSKEVNTQVEDYGDLLC